MSLFGELFILQNAAAGPAIVMTAGTTLKQKKNLPPPKNNLPTLE
jgi:hypothetical protein